MKTKDFITEVIDLPREERAMVVDSILKSLNNGSQLQNSDCKNCGPARERVSQETTYFKGPAYVSRICQVTSRIRDCQCSVIC